MKKVYEVMAGSLLNVETNTSLEKVLEMFLEHKIKHLPVLSSAGNLMGIVSDRDVRVAIDSPFLGLMPAEKMKTRLKSRMVGDIMQCDVETIDRDQTVLEAAKKMQKHNISCLPILNKQKELEGIITQSDIVNIFIDYLQSGEKN